MVFRDKYYPVNFLRVKHEDIFRGINCSFLHESSSHGQIAASHESMNHELAIKIMLFAIRTGLPRQPDKSLPKVSFLIRYPTEKLSYGFLSLGRQLCPCSLKIIVSTFPDIILYQSYGRNRVFQPVGLGKITHASHSPASDFVGLHIFHEFSEPFPALLRLLNFVDYRLGIIFHEEIFQAHFGGKPPKLPHLLVYLIYFVGEATHHILEYRILVPYAEALPAHTIKY